MNAMITMFLRKRIASWYRMSWWVALAFAGLLFLAYESASTFLERGLIAFWAIWVIELSRPSLFMLHERLMKLSKISKWFYLILWLLIFFLGPVWLLFFWVPLVFKAYLMRDMRSNERREWQHVRNVGMRCVRLLPGFPQKVGKVVVAEEKTAKKLLFFLWIASWLATMLQLACIEWVKPFWLSWKCEVLIMVGLLPLLTIGVAALYSYVTITLMNNEE